MTCHTRLSDVIVKLPDRSTCRVERRLVAMPNRGGALHTQFICTLPTGELVTWLAGKKYRLPDGTVGIEVAHGSAPS
ncbi:hypothetical protein [Achromobacter sp.]|uniref:hypothetical protein n=1 Tax=Achromobacter sp. TaxID=134375 RepID=UPI0028B0AD97|nr:hypothetical protein [Achromobacter sp.]